MCFSAEHLPGMNGFKNKIILVNTKLVFSIGSNGAPLLPDSRHLRNEKV